jgi:pimeloyl-ACP methyl ester carboxylesterase
MEINYKGDLSMKRLLAFMVFSFVCISVQAQTPKLPHPVIFLHGLVSNETTWDQAVTALGGSAKIFDVCLNHDGNTATASLTSSDISIIGWRDGTTTPSPNRLYVMNYDHTRFSASGHSTHTQSNQSAIYKQGVAVKAMIQAVLAIENADKVILVGHSMGGLESREYLQRGFNGSNYGTNWVDQTSSQGHKVVKLVTTGTPHLGSNMTGTALSTVLAGIDEKSEACRDLRYPSNKIVVPFTAMPAPYLFGGNENTYLWGPSSTINPYNYDFNCNGSIADAITALSSGTTYNGSMPLPLNIWYTYITSNASSGTDGLVETARQWLYNGSTPTPASADTILLGINHIIEPNDILSIIRGMDEPQDSAYAYTLTPGQATRGFITHGMNWNESDIDVFRLQAINAGSFIVSLTGLNSGITSFSVSTKDGTVETKAAGDGTTTITVSGVSAGTTYYITVWGTATATSHLNPYALAVSGTALPVELTSFTAFIEKGNVLLNWQTATEVNNYGFEVERRAVKSEQLSVNSWEKIGFVSGAGTSNSPKEYSYSDPKSASGRYIYRLKQIDNDGKFKYSQSIEAEIGSVPKELYLHQNYPNPFNPATTIRYDVPQQTTVKIAVYDMIGREVATLVNETKEAGSYEVIFTASQLASGVYFYKLSTGTATAVRKLLVAK